MSWDLKPVYLTSRTFLIFNQTYERFLRGYGPFPFGPAESGLRRPDPALSGHILGRWIIVTPCFVVCVLTCPSGRLAGLSRQLRSTQTMRRSR